MAGSGILVLDGRVEVLDLGDGVMGAGSLGLGGRVRGADWIWVQVSGLLNLGGNVWIVVSL